MILLCNFSYFCLKLGYNFLLDETLCDLTPIYLSTQLSFLFSHSDCALATLCLSQFLEYACSGLNSDPPKDMFTGTCECYIIWEKKFVGVIK